MVLPLLFYFITFAPVCNEPEKFIYLPPNYTPTLNPCNNLLTLWTFLYHDQKAHRNPAPRIEGGGGTFIKTLAWAR